MKRTVLEDKKPCACGCGIMIPLTDRRGRPHDFVQSHSGRRHTEYQLNRYRELGKLKIGAKNNNWKGDNITRHNLHKWLRSRIPIPEFCQFCNKQKAKDLANITGVYSRDLDNWKYLCRKCHINFDDSVNKSWAVRKGKRKSTGHLAY